MLKRLREAISDAGFQSLAEASRAIGEKSTQGLRDVVAGRKRCSVELLMRLGDAGVNITYVMTGERTEAASAVNEGLIDTKFLAEIAGQLDRIIDQAGKKLPTGPGYVRMVAEVYNFLVEQGTRDAETTDRVLRLVVNR